MSALNGICRSIVDAFIALAIFGCLCAPVHAQITLKPGGQSGTALRLKSFDATANVQSQFATTQMTLVFQNEVTYETEADFIYRLPENTVVTRFAYWYGNERVLARIVEKERAREIYQKLTYVSRDPALVEMINHNTFRARISPVAANADLKVEMTLVSTLPSRGTDFVYQLPLKETVVDDLLDHIHLNVMVHPDPSITGVADNFGVLAHGTKGGYSVGLTASNYKASDTFSVVIRHKPVPLRASIYSARSGGDSGFFALALTAEHTVIKPAVSINGIRTDSIVNDPSRIIKPGHVWLVVGRYRDSGDAVVSVTGADRRSYKQTVHFGSAQETNNVATKLWASAWINHLQNSGKNRSAIVAASNRYTLPSAYTSWLAIPSEERLRLAREKADPKIYELLPKLSQAILEHVPEESQLRKQLNYLLLIAKENVDDQLKSSIADDVARLELSMQMEVLNGNGGTSSSAAMRSKLNVWLQRSGIRESDILAKAVSSAKEQLSRERAKKWASTVVSTGVQSPSSKAAAQSLKEVFEPSDRDLLSSVVDAFRVSKRQPMEKYIELVGAGKESSAEAVSCNQQVMDLDTAITSILTPSEQLDSYQIWTDNEYRHELASARLRAAASRLASHLVTSPLDTAGIQRDSDEFKWLEGLVDDGMRRDYLVFQDVARQLQPDANAIATTILHPGNETAASAKAHAKIAAICTAAGFDFQRMLRNILWPVLLTTIEKQAKVVGQEEVENRSHSVANMAARNVLQRVLPNTDWTLKDAINEYISPDIIKSANELGNYAHNDQLSSAKARALTAHLTRLCSVVGESPNKYMTDVLQHETEDIADQLANNVAMGADTLVRRKLQKRLDYLCGVSGQKPADIVKEHYGELQDQIADAYCVSIHDRKAYRHSAEKNPVRAAVLHKQLLRLEALGGGSAQEAIDIADVDWTIQDAESTIELLEAEQKKSKPNPDLKSQLAEKAYVLTSRASDALRSESLDLSDYELRWNMSYADRAESLTDRLLVASGVSPESPRGRKLAAQSDSLGGLSGGIMNQLRAQYGDPLIQVYAPVDSRSVTAIMPDGSTKVLIYNAEHKCWEARFDIPGYVHDGQYIIEVVVFSKLGIRTVTTLHYRVDLAAPAITSTASIVESAGQSVLRIDATAPEKIARVSVTLPDGTDVKLDKSLTNDTDYVGLIPIPVGQNWHNKPVHVAAVSAAHNITEIDIQVP